MAQRLYCLYFHEVTKVGVDTEGRCRECRREINRRHNATEKRQASRRRYENSSAGRDIRIQYNQSALGVLSVFRKRINESMRKHVSEMEGLDVRLWQD